MNRREAKRARRTAAWAAPDVATVPAPLRSRFDPLWSDAAAVEHLAEALGLTLDVGTSRLRTEGHPARPTLAEAHPWRRFDAFRAAWCEAAGLTHPRRDGLLDGDRCKAAGIDTSTGSRWSAQGRGFVWETRP